MNNNNIALVREKVTANMADNLAMLRTKLGLTQVQLANLIGVSRHTIMQVENKKAKLSWNTFLSLLLVFIKNPETDKLLNILEIYTEELNNELKIRWNFKSYKRKGQNNEWRSTME